MTHKQASRAILIKELIQSAQKLLSTGHPKQAEKLLRRNLSGSNRNNPTLLTLLSSSFAQQGNWKYAERFLRDAIAAQPVNPSIYCNLAVTLTHQGKPEEALRYYKIATNMTPILPEAHYNMGILYRQLGNTENALIEFNISIKQRPDFIQAYNSLANTYRDQGRLDTAIEHYKTALRLHPASTATCVNLALALQQAGYHDSSLEYFDRAISLHPTNEEAHLGIAGTYLAQGLLDKAKIKYNELLEINDESIPALFGLANTLYLSEEFELASSYYETVLKKDPSNFKAHVNLGNTMHELGHYQKSADHYKQALIINESDPDTLYNFGNTLIELGLVNEAIEHYRRALAFRPDNEEIHWDLSRALLISGNFLQGWSEYEWRLKRKEKVLRSFPQARWHGEQLKGKIILVHAEQGIGDEINFSSCLPDLIQDTESIIFNCDPRLANIFKRSFPQIIIHGGQQDEPIDWISHYPTADYQVPLASLPGFYRKDSSSFPQRRSYIYPDPGRLHYWMQRLSKLPCKHSIGISWKGGANKRTRNKRSIDLSHWETLLSIKNVNFIDLQYGMHEREMRSFITRSGHTIHSFKEVDPLTDLDEFSALISALDLVITVDNSTAHIAGALGKPTFILLPFSPDWRWLLDGSTSLWYPSAQLLRQPSSGAWDRVLDEAYEQVARHLSEV